MAQLRSISQTQPEGKTKFDVVEREIYRLWGRLLMLAIYVLPTVALVRLAGFRAIDQLIPGLSQAKFLDLLVIAGILYIWSQCRPAGA